MSYLWKCQDLFEDRNQIFKHSSHPVRSPPAGTSPPESFTGSFNRSADFYGDFMSNITPTQNQQTFVSMRERTLSSSSDSANSSFSELDIFRKSSPKKIGPNYCTFCKTNGEVKEVYAKHCLKKFVDSKFVVQCPILRKLTCKICGASGDDAHTVTHCPKGSVVIPVAKELKSFSFCRRK